MISASRYLILCQKQLPRLFKRFAQTQTLHDSRSTNRNLGAHIGQGLALRQSGTKGGIGLPSEVAVRQVIAHLRPILNSKNTTAVEEGVHKTLSCFPTSPSQRAKVYEGVVEFLLREMWAHPAISVFNRLQKHGFVPSLNIKAQVLAVSLVNAKDRPETLLGQLQDVTSNPNYTEDDLVKFLSVATDYALPLECVAVCLTSFLGSRGPEYEPRSEVLLALMRVSSKAGQLTHLFDSRREVEEAEALLEVLEETESSGSKLSGKQALHLMRSIGNPQSADDAVLQVLDTLTKADLTPTVAVRAAESLLTNRQVGYSPSPKLLKALVVALINADAVDKAFVLLERLKAPEKNPAIHHAFLATLSHLRPNDNRPFVKLLASMNDAGIEIDHAIFNILIAREVRLGRVANALTMYSEMKSNPALLPDSYTFASMFTMYRRIKPRSVKNHVRNENGNSSTCPIRHLFREMVLSTERQKSPISIHTALLNTALRAFMRRRDYAAAIITIQAFSHFQVPLDHKTYYTVVKMLIRRIWTEVRGSRARDSVRWVDYLLGVNHYTDIQLGQGLVQQVFTALRRQDFELSAPLYIPRRPGRRRAPHVLLSRHYEAEGLLSFPTMDMMESIEKPEPSEFAYDPIPLQRFLAKALVAETGVMGLGPGDTQAEILNKLLALAAKEML